LDTVVKGDVGSKTTSGVSLPGGSSRPYATAPCGMGDDGYFLYFPRWGPLDMTGVGALIGRGPGTEERDSCLLGLRAVAPLKPSHQLLRARTQTLVAPRAGAWIETASIGGEEINGSASPSDFATKPLPSARPDAPRELISRN